MTPKQKACKLYRDAYMRWCYELSHDKNVATAKSICEYICNEVLGDMGADRGYEFWSEVKWFIVNSTHRELYLQENKAIIKYNSGLGALLCSKCRVIIKTGKDFTEEEHKFAIREIEHLNPLYCEKCKNHE